MSTKVPLPDPQRARCKRLIAAKGHAKAAELLGCSRPTLDRAIGGLELLPGTVALINQAIAERDAERKDP